MHIKRALIGFCLVIALVKLWPSDRSITTATFAYFPTLAILILAVILLLWIRRYPLVFAALILLVLFIFYLENRRIFVGNRQPPASSIRVLHWNVWGARSGAPALAAAMRKNKPDIVCLNEPKESLKATFYPPYEKYFGDKWHILNEANVTIVSHFPLSLLQIYKGYGCRGIFARVDATPRVEILLLDVSPEFDNLRQKTFEQLESRLSRVGTLPDIIAGDFNTTSLAHSLSPLYEMGYADSYREAGSGIGYTWPNILPIIKIDYIFVQKRWKVTYHQSGFTRLSDHAWQFTDIVAR
jgi:endonuclease/exonuclease/phosphatase (EEP) superfamily protein YafD